MNILFHRKKYKKFHYLLITGGQEVYYSDCIAILKTQATKSNVSHYYFEKINFKQE